MSLDRDEAEANLFAMYLLVPESMLRADLREMGKACFDIESDDAIKKLAERYGVSVQLMTIRLTQIGAMAP